MLTLHEEIEYRLRTVAAHAYMRGKHSESVDQEFINKEIEMAHKTIVLIVKSALDNNLNNKG